MQELVRELRENPGLLGEKLFALGRLDLCHQLVALVPDPGLRSVVEESSLTKSLEKWSDSKNPLAPMHAWQHVSQDFSGRFATLFPILESTSDNNARQFLLQFFEHLQLPSHEQDALASASVGTQMLAILPAPEQLHFSHLFASPALLIESFLLSELLWPIPEMIQKLPELFTRGILTDDLLVRYATKAVLDFRLVAMSTVRFRLIACRFSSQQISPKTIANRLVAYWVLSPSPTLEFEKVTDTPELRVFVLPQRFSISARILSEQVLSHF